MSKTKQPAQRPLPLGASKTPSPPDLQAIIADTHQRVVRIETRQAKLMKQIGLNPDGTPVKE